MEFSDFTIRIVCAVVSGLLIGVEREFKNKSAGLKTNALVALGAAVFVLISLKYTERDFTDITRVLGQVVTGIGFLGAGTILQQKDKVKGLTTAATVWCSAGAGCLAATAMFWELATLTVLVIFVNFTFGIIDSKLGNAAKTSKDTKNKPS